MLRRALLLLLLVCSFQFAELEAMTHALEHLQDAQTPAAAGVPHESRTAAALCAKCLSLGVLAHAMASTVAPLLALALSLTLFVAPLLAPAPLRALTQRSRGPPTSR